MKVNIGHVGLVHTKISSKIVWPVVDLNVPEVVYLFPFLSLGCDVIAGGNLQDLVNAKIVVRKILYLMGLLIEFV